MSKGSEDVDLKLLHHQLYARTISSYC